MAALLLTSKAKSGFTSSLKVITFVIIYSAVMAEIGIATDDTPFVAVIMARLLTLNMYLLV